MPLVASFRRHAARWCALAAVLLAMATLPAAARPMLCGTYADEGGTTTLTLQSEGHGRLSSAYAPAEPLRLGLEGRALGLANLATGRVERWEVSEDGRTISGAYRDFTLQQAATCAPVPEAAEGSCHADPVTCLEELQEAAPAQLQAWCAEIIPAACTQLIERYQDTTNEQRPAAQPDEPAMPAYCDEASPAFDAEGCMATAKVFAVEMMGKALLALQRRRDAVLPAAQLDVLAALCSQQPGEALCDGAAQALWNAGRLLPARQALQHACDQRAGASACGPLAALAALPASALQPVAAETLPCGRYASEQGLLPQLQFGDAGRVTVEGLDSHLRARLQDGQVHLRRDLGSDIVLQRLHNGDLVGMDHDTRFARYVRSPSAATATCSAPVTYVEQPLPLDCPTLARPDGAAQCCAEGRLLGCKVAGDVDATRVWPAMKGSDMDTPDPR
ncbi:MAG: hypothetical protein GAK31_03808 [Stenotrophomonas maltophilia]|uniref:Secreted protein n=1 Tax=Stenotrophomonas maltophilia TaxID=40324 RepID=A0A7V8JK73_STEMA|nr:MAG: hypothetical protein GAK31_03808 [Stenotrophomonas maltophilia]